MFNTELEKWHLTGLGDEHENPFILLNSAQHRKLWMVRYSETLVSNDQWTFMNDHKPFWIMFSETQSVKSEGSEIRI